VAFDLTFRWLHQAQPRHRRADRAGDVRRRRDTLAQPLVRETRLVLRGAISLASAVSIFTSCRHGADIRSITERSHYPNILK